MDGARLGHALTAESNDVTLEDVAKFTDVFYLGGTKNGALLGEAIIINRQNLQEEFGFHIKQKGAMLAKRKITRNSVSRVDERRFILGFSETCQSTSHENQANFQRNRL